jgi:endonuclease-8
VLARLGPDVLDPAFDSAHAARRALAASEDRAVAELLLDQRVACGMGNIAKSEALWACRTDPFAPPEAVGLERLAEIYEAGRAWLTAGVQGGGDAPRRIYGRPACPRCGTRSARQAQGDDGRTTWWCPHCQSASSPDPG